ncbi:MAG: type II toxin-antitoxin system VapC family toxin [Deltaproteobacteria bacterium]|nr:type II toxin-antitoxin system VapC family toxin [Deltaproteobacteria bacterium]
MILYLDTSALVKVYVEEAHTEQVRNWVDEATVVATSVVAYAEASAAFARKRREGGLGPEDLEQVLAALDRDWGDYAVLEVRERVAGALAVKHGLRGFDAIHLAAALELKSEAVETIVALCAFDERLVTAAKTEGCSLLGPQNGTGET